MIHRLTLATVLTVAAAIGSSARIATADEESRGGPRAGPKPTQELYDEIAQFTQVWKKEESGWKLARVLSYDHRLTE